ncbi:putative protein kinase RLK-Pelle-LRR-XV family [Helianthus annuus]|nr:putative protein kinase RLK-Pelle-LRR-XV family [Helianthus annuus]
MNKSIQKIRNPSFIFKFVSPNYIPTKNKKNKNKKIKLKNKNSQTRLLNELPLFHLSPCSLFPLFPNTNSRVRVLNFLKPPISHFRSSNSPLIFHQDSTFIKTQIMNPLHNPLNLLILISIILTSSFSHFISGQDSDKSALLEFKSAVSDPSGVLSSWNSSGSDHCSWIGVTCGSGSRVVAVNITGGGNFGDFTCLMYDQFMLYGFGVRKDCVDRNVKLVGQLSGAIGRLSELRVLSLPFNDLSGEIPVEIWGLEKLEIGDNCGEISDKLGVPCMTVFDVSGNHLSGRIPSFRYTTCAPFNPSNAYLRYFASNDIRTPSLVPNDVGDLSITHNFRGNNFTGQLASVPIARTGENTVYAFLAGENELTGAFPGTLFENCVKLKAMAVNVSSNALSGQLPLNIGQLCRTLSFLDVSGNRISGTIPSSFGELSSLVAVNLSWNMLIGEIPVSFNKIKDLKSLSISGNHLTGRIPTGLGKLGSLEVLELFSNSLTGEIPGDLVYLKNLSVLLLNNNKLSGPIPSGLANIKTIMRFNVSFNNLSGPLPQNDNLMECSSVLGNPNLQSCKVSPPNSSPDQPVGNDSANVSSPSVSQSKGGRGLSSIAIASIICASAIFTVMLALMVLFLCTKWRPKSGSRACGHVRKEVTVFTDIGVPLTFENVVRSTGSFNASNCIGNGGFGATYKAEISPGFLVAIKRLSVGRFQGVQQFDAEIKTLGRLRHQNLVTLIGYHASETEMFLIYNYLPGGNLERFIQERSIRAIDWRILHKIALDIARALAYLHDQCVPRVLHRDVKPSNILLDDDLNAYLSDFGLARLLGTSETHATTGVAGTFGYVAPEYAMTCRVSDKADVYSYGVVLLELISDKKALDPSFSSYGNGFNIVAWACMLLRQGRAKEFFTEGLWDAGPHDDLVEVLHLAVVCTVDSLSTRPTMKQVVRRLKQLQPPSC